VDNQQTRSASLDDQLDELLSESVEAARAREISTFDDLTGDSGGAFVLFGAGSLGRKTASGMRDLGMEAIAFADNNPLLWGTSVDGVPVISPAEAGRQYGRSAAFITTIWSGSSSGRQVDRVRQLRDLGCRTVVPFGYLYWKYPEVFLPHWSLNIPHRILEHADDLRTLWSFWGDEDSRREYLSQLRFRLWLDYGALRPPAPHLQYFADDLFSLSDHEVLIDCGAYDGDTIREFTQRRGSSFAAIRAYEPDEANFSRLQDFLAHLDPPISRKVTVRKFAVGAEFGSVGFVSEGSIASRVDIDSTVQVACVTLDGDLADIRPTYIKMDVEGSEMDALRGAAKTIHESRPILAICVYHKPEDLREVPLLINSLSDDYRYFLRSHDEEGWELVCYAVPSDRLV
jgi:FkbM family methyltransferase